MKWLHRTRSRYELFFFKNRRERHNFRECSHASRQLVTFSTRALRPSGFWQTSAGTHWTCTTQHLLTRRLLIRCHNAYKNLVKLNMARLNFVQHFFLTGCRTPVTGVALAAQISHKVAYERPERYLDNCRPQRQSWWRKRDMATR